MENEKLKEDLERARLELWMLHQVTTAMRTTLKLDQILYIILTALTSHEGMAFNRAMLFLVDNEKKLLEGKMAIGPDSGEEADRIWRQIEIEKKDLADLISAYDHFRRNPETKLNQIIKNIKIPIKEDAGILALTILEGMPFQIDMEEARKKVADDIQEALGLEYFVTVPLKGKNRILGVILVDNIFTKKPITNQDINILSMFADHAGLAIENSRLYEMTLHETHIDWLTDLLNHGRFQYLLSQQIQEAKKNDTPLSLAMIDIDNFKIYNDELGHQDGDKALAKVGKILKELSRKEDMIARYGGEEFAIIMTNTKKDEAAVIAERLRKEIEDIAFAREEILPNKSFTASFGIAAFPHDAKDKDGLIRCADRALYEAKRLGKNRVQIYR